MNQVSKTKQTAHPTYERPLVGLRVVDMSQGVAGPYCAMLLAQAGADVVKIEPPNGDWARVLGDIHGNHTAFSIAANLGKRSIVVDLKHEKSRSVVDPMIAGADVFIEGFRPGVTERLRYGYDRLKAMNPKLIYVSVSGFGQTGPMRERPAMDPMLQAFTGFMSENKGADGIPHRTPVIYFDMSTGLYATQAVMGSLFARAHEPEGRRINVSLMEAAASVQAVRLLSATVDGPFTSTVAPSGTFATADGHIQIIVVRDAHFTSFCKAMGLPDIAADARFKTAAGRRENMAELNEVIRALFATNTTAHWQDRLSEAGLQNEAVQSYPEFARHPQSEAVAAIAWLRQPGSDAAWPVPNVPGLPRYEAGSPYAVSPALGQHTRELLGEYGLETDAIDELFAEGVVG